MVSRWLSRLFGGSKTSSYQSQVDSVSQPTEAERVREAERNSLFGADQFSPQTTEPEPTEHPQGVFGSIIAGIGAMKGLNQLAEQLQQGGSWFDQLNMMSTELSEPARLGAVQSAIQSLSPESQTELAQRLGSGVDPAEQVAAMLASPDGFRQLVSSLLPASPDATTSDSDPTVVTNPPPESRANLLQAMRDPLIRDFARTLIPALVRAKSEEQDSASESTSGLSGFANDDDTD